MAEHESQDLAERVAEAMIQTDGVVRHLGLEVTGMAPGRATVQMTVRAEMLNGFRTCHGGYLTVLADTAFAYACNTGNECTVASGLSIDFVAPAREGDRLSAEAQRVSEAGRTGVYDVTVRNAAGDTVAVFRGRSYRLKGRPVIPA
jgi:acyl-CoA thioesterase